MTDDKNQPTENQPVSPHQRVLKMAPQVYYGYPNPQLMHIHADDVQETLPEEELPEEYGGELVGYSPVSVPYRKSSSERAGKEALAYLALAIVANPFVYILGGPILGEETLVSLFGAGVGFSMLSFGILPLVLLVFSLWAVINFFAVLVKSTGKRETEERIKFRLVYEYTPSSEGSQEGDASPRYGDIDQPVMDPGPPPTSFQKQKAWLLFLGVSVLNPYIAAAIFSVTALFGRGELVAALFVTVNHVSAGLMGIPGIIWFVAWIMSIARLAEANEA